MWLRESVWSRIVFSAGVRSSGREFRERRTEPWFLVGFRVQRKDLAQHWFSRYGERTRPNPWFGRLGESTKEQAFGRFRVQRKEMAKPWFGRFRVWIKRQGGTLVLSLDSEFGKRNSEKGMDQTLVQQVQSWEKNPGPTLVWSLGSKFGEGLGQTLVQQVGSTEKRMGRTLVWIQSLEKKNQA